MSNYLVTNVRLRYRATAADAAPDGAALPLPPAFPLPSLFHLHQD
jgi:hypothetical protein